MAAAATVILAIGFAVMRHSREQNGRGMEPVGVLAPDSAAIVGGPTASGKAQPVEHTEQKKQIVPRKAMAQNREPASQMVEVIVLPDEREAFARFVARLAEEKQVAAGLPHLAPKQEDAPMEIAPLRIGLADGDGRFTVMLNLERSWVEGDVALNSTKAAGTSPSNSAEFKDPIIRQFKTDLTLAMKDGQTIQTTQSADPLSGRVLTITATMNVVK